MPETDADTKSTRLMLLISLFEQQPKRVWVTGELAKQLGCTTRTVQRYIGELEQNGRLPLEELSQGHYRIMEGGRVLLDALRLDLREATALYLAARLLAQQTDEHNAHVASALEKLLGAKPSSLTAPLRVLATAAASMHARGTDVSEIFSVLVQGWAHQKVVLLRYRARNAPHAIEHRFCPYLFEPSGIGRTIYVLGATQPKGELRTFKMERIQRAALLDDSFVVPAEFDGPALLKRAWGVMYGDEAPVEVLLRFSHYVAQRVKKTVWHSTEVRGIRAAVTVVAAVDVRPLLPVYVSTNPDMPSTARAEHIPVGATVNCDPGRDMGLGFL
jgi:predicted DNA-binding transcriptional regulator YafY